MKINKYKKFRKGSKLYKGCFYQPNKLKDKGYYRET